MKSEWKTVKVAELGEIVTGKTPKTSVKENYGGNIAFLTPSDDMSVKYITKTVRTLSESGVDEVRKKLLPPNTVCVSCIGSDLGKVVMTTDKTVTNQQINSIIVDESRFDPSFVYYLMVILGKRLNFISKTSTAVPIVNKKTFSEYEVDCPSLEVQKRVANILSVLDDKIALNQKINENLEQQAQTLFKSWFVDFEPFDRVRPDSWAKVTLEEVTDLITRGIAPKYSEESDQIVLNQKCIRNHVVDLSLSRTHTPKKINEKWLKFGDILINSTGTGTLGRTAQIWFQPEKMTVDSHITIVRPSASELIFYLGIWCISHEREIETLHTGSTGQTELPRDRVKAIELLRPDKETLNRFNAVVEPMVITIVANQEENQRLSALRDTLLPRLMSGEIDVEGIEL